MNSQPTVASLQQDSTPESSDAFRVSVIIPVYNASAFVREAVASALVQPETAEIILVEDGSSDDSLQVCERLARESAIVFLCRHPNGENRGAGASRNLGIEKSTCEYVAFLDADDFYLPERFSSAGALFSSDPDIDGVYEAIGTLVQSEIGHERWRAGGRSPEQLTTMTRTVAPEDLFRELVNGGAGYFSIDGLVVKRTALQKIDLFDEHLRLHQDTALIFKLAAVTRLVPGRLEQPVAIRRVHDHNRILVPRSQRELDRDRALMADAVWRWGRQRLEGLQAESLTRLYVTTRPVYLRWTSFPVYLRHFRKQATLAHLAYNQPATMRTPMYWSMMRPDPAYWRCKLEKVLRSIPPPRHIR